MSLAWLNEDFSTGRLTKRRMEPKRWQAGKFVSDVPLEANRSLMRSHTEWGPRQESATSAAPMQWQSADKNAVKEDERSVSASPVM